VQGGKTHAADKKNIAVLIAGHSPLTRAVDKKNIAVLMLLLQAPGIDINATGQSFCHFFNVSVIV
jgi:hypothetical protein